METPPEPPANSIWNFLGAGGGTYTDIRNNRALSLWSMAWAAAIIAAAAIVASGIVSGPVVWFVALTPNLLALAVLRAYLRFLSMTDELQRRIQLEALAVGFGLGYFAVIAHVVAQSAGAPALDSMWWVLVFTFGLIAGHLRAPEALPVKNRLRVLRAERQWTQAELAARLDVSRQTVNAIETGKFDPALPLAFKLGDVFGLRIEEVFLRD